MTVYQTLRDEFTSDEISEFCLERYNLSGVTLSEDGISFNRESGSDGGYGWFPLSDRALTDLLSAMREG